MSTDKRRPDTLGLSAEEMKKLGYWVVDQVVEHALNSHERPVISAPPAGDLMKKIGGPVPEQGSEPMAVMQEALDNILTNMQHGDHPRYFARVPGPSSFAGILGDWLSTGLNGIAASWGGGAGPTTAELVVCEWLAKEFGLPKETEGVIASGGSMANMIATVTARTEMGEGIIYLSEQVHSSINRNLRAMQVPDAHIRILPTDDLLRLSLPALEEAIAKDKKQGLKPTIIIASAGTTNSGSVDDLDALADIAQRETMWLHVDGAYGAPAALCDKGRAVMKGLSRVDSLVLDPHKWLFQPYDMGIVLVRRPGAMERSFSMHPEYLADVTAQNGEIDIRDRTLELTRRSRAVKLWLTIRIHGMETIRAALSRGIELAEEAEKMIRADARLEIITPAQLGIVTFMIKGEDKAQHADRADRLTKDGFAAMTSSTLLGKPVLRFCTINPRTTTQDIALTLEKLMA